MNAEELIGRYAAGERDFIGADLRNICLMDTFLTDINLRSANLEDSLLMRNFLINANLTGANLKKVNLSDSILRTVLEQRRSASRAKNSLRF
ncbi:pentapeptide repeat-containing protein [Microcoleus sp. MON2_D6]|uniref:pentapeptide repeat-containing protein n=1 Tax=unclassified Microcoleus TaxID=2642155 RepID=UPI002FD3C883